MTTFETTPEQFGEGVAMFREQVIPWLKDSTGFRGWITLVDPERHRSLSVTFWATAEAAADSPESGSALRDEITARVGATMQTLDIYEVAVVEALELTELD